MKRYLWQLTAMMSPPATPHWIAPDPTFRSGVWRTVAAWLAVSLSAVLVLSSGQFGEFRLFRLTVTDEAGALHTFSTFSLGTYNGTALLQMFGGQAFHNNITYAHFENTPGQGIVVDNIYAIPEPSSLLLAASAMILALRRNGPRHSVRLKLLTNPPSPNAYP